MKSEFARCFTVNVAQAPPLASFLHHSIFEFHKEFGWLLYSFVMGGLILSIISSKREDWLMLSAFSSFYLYLACTPLSYRSHYDLPLVPFSIIFAARFLVWFGEKFCWRKIYKIIVFSIVIFTLGNAIYYNFIFLTNKKYLLTAGEWINSNIPVNSSIGTAEYPSFGYQGFPPFNLLNYRINKEQKSEYYIIIGDENAGRKDAKFLNEYRLIKEFERYKTFLDKFYHNYRIYYLNQKIRIYSSV